MRIAILMICFCITSESALQAQLLKNVLQGKDSSKAGQVMKDILQKTGNKAGNSLNTQDAINGLKEALQTGAQRSAEKLSATDGFFGNAILKILLPPEAKNAEKTLRALGMGQLLDDAVLSMNRAAEDAAQFAAPIFVQAVQEMKIEDAWGLLHGSDSAATAYLRSKTAPALAAAFTPVIEKSLQKTDAPKYWQAVFSNYNRFAARRINPNLTAYVTEKALAGIFLQLKEEEKQIRKNPAARTTALLKKVFGN
jgi:hypothetical protein